MSYNTDHLRTAGKITVYTSFLGIVIFAVVFIFNLGTTEIKEAGAQTSPEQATTTVTVLNTPPYYVIDAQEYEGSSTSTPTNAGETIIWTATANDANAERYYLLICSDNATPTANASAAPTCNATTSATTWAVSASTTANQQVILATTTTAGMAEINAWFAWVCDDNANSPRCSATSTQGSGTTSSPFEINHRPAFSAFWDSSPVDPGGIVTFYSTSSDTDVSGDQDKVRLIVCSTNSFSTSTDTCGGTLLGSTTVSAATTSNATATYSIQIPTQDQDYNAFGFVIDWHGFESSGVSQGTNATITVNNVAPTVGSSTISVNGGSNMILTVASGETTGFTLQFTATDSNSCDAIGGTSYDEITDYALTLYRSGASSTCDNPYTSTYNANNCYVSSVPTTTWNLSCTASTTSCGNPTTDTSTVFDCTFPLWYIADPTDGTATSTQYSGATSTWLARVSAVDDDFATSATGTQAQSGVDVQSFLAFALVTSPEIPYGALAPGQQTDPLIATTTIAATGNVGIDKRVVGESMCTTYTGATLCPNSSSSTIPESQQRFATDTLSFASSTALSSTTYQLVDIDVPKSTATSTQAQASAYWGIAVPSAITYSGDYFGENTFIAVVSEQWDW